jgi:hypothetical protein
LTKEKRYKPKGYVIYLINNIRKFSNLKNVLLIYVQEASRTPKGHDQSRNSPWHIIIKTISTENKKRILKVVKEKKTMYKGKPIKITADSSMETIKAKRAWSEVFQQRIKIVSALGKSTQQNYHSKLME